MVATAPAKEASTPYRRSPGVSSIGVYERTPDCVGDVAEVRFRDQVTVVLSAEELAHPLIGIDGMRLISEAPDPSLVDEADQCVARRSFISVDRDRLFSVEDDQKHSRKHNSVYLEDRLPPVCQREIPSNVSPAKTTKAVEVVVRQPGYKG